MSGNNGPYRFRQLLATKSLTLSDFPLANTTLVHKTAAFDIRGFDQIELQLITRNLVGASITINALAGYGSGLSPQIVTAHSGAIAATDIKPKMNWHCYRDAAFGPTGVTQVGATDAAAQGLITMPSNLCTASVVFWGQQMGWTFAASTAMTAYTGDYEVYGIRF